MAAFLPPAGLARSWPAQGLGPRARGRQPTPCPRWSATAAPPPSPAPLPSRLSADVIPPWAGDSLLARAVTALIGVAPIYAVLKWQAKAVLVRTAERKGVPWVATRDAILDAVASDAALAAATDAAVAYPDYYLRPFHAYADGNLCWEAAAEAEAATQVVGLRTFPAEPLTPAQAFDRLRTPVYEQMAAALDGPRGVGVNGLRLVVDVGCGVGLGTVALRSFLADRQAAAAAAAGSNVPPPDLQVLAVDLSPHMLAVAAARAAAPGVTYVHGRAEALPVPPGTAGLVALQFVIHEMPAAAIAASMGGAHDALAPGGVLALLDNNPESAVLRGLPPALFSLMKSTEPHSDEYYPFDVEAALAAAGFVDVQTVATDHRHRTVTAVKAGLGGA